MEKRRRLCGILFLAAAGVCAAGGESKKKGWALYEIRNPREGTLRYERTSKLPPAGSKEASGQVIEEADGTLRRMVGKWADEEDAKKRQAELEALNIMWGVFRVEAAGGERYEVKRAPSDHPKKLKKPDGSVWHLLKRCETEEKARKELARIQEKAAEKAQDAREGN